MNAISACLSSHLDITSCGCGRAQGLLLLMGESQRPGALPVTHCIPSVPLQVMTMGRSWACHCCSMRHRGPGPCLPPTVSRGGATLHWGTSPQGGPLWQGAGMMLEVSRASLLVPALAAMHPLHVLYEGCGCKWLSA